MYGLCSKMHFPQPNRRRKTLQTQNVTASNVRVVHSVKQNFPHRERKRNRLQIVEGGSRQSNFVGRLLTSTTQLAFAACRWVGLFVCEVFLSIQNTMQTHREKQSMSERANVVKEELQEQDIRFLAVYVEAKNSIMIMLSEKEDKLGTLAIAVPKPKDLVGSVTSSVMLGDNNVISAGCSPNTSLLKRAKSPWSPFTWKRCRRCRRNRSLCT